MHLRRFLKRFSRMLVLFGVLSGMVGCSWWAKPFEEPDIKVVSFIALPGENFLEQRFELKLRLTNPNDLRLDIKGLVFEFSVEGVELMRGSSRDIPVIEPYGEAEFSVEGSANMLDAVKLLFNELQGDPDAQFDYVLKSRIDLADHWPSTFHITRDGKIDLLKSSEKRSKDWH